MRTKDTQSEGRGTEYLHQEPGAVLLYMILKPGAEASSQDLCDFRVSIFIPVWVSPSSRNVLVILFLRMIRPLVLTPSCTFQIHKPGCSQPAFTQGEQNLSLIAACFEAVGVRSKMLS